MFSVDHLRILLCSFDSKDSTLRQSWDYSSKQLHRETNLCLTTACTAALSARIKKYLRWLCVTSNLVVHLPHRCEKMHFFDFPCDYSIHDATINPARQRKLITPPTRKGCSMAAQQIFNLWKIPCPRSIRLVNKVTHPPLYRKSQITSVLPLTDDL